MKTLLLATVLLFAPLAAHAACAATDFAVQDFKPSFSGAGMTTRISLRGKLVNNCATAAAAKLQIDIKDDSGAVIESKQAWPAGTSNIDPGKAADFDMGRLFRFKSGMSAFTVSVVEVRTW